MKPKICFFIKTNNPEIVNFIEFYKIDIQILRELGYEVIVCTRLSKLPLDSDLYFVWWWTYAIFPCIIGILRKKPVLITGTFNLASKHSGLTYYSRPLYQRVIIKFSAYLADENIVVSKYELNKFKNEICKNVVYIPHSLDIPKYESKPLLNRQDFIFTIAGLEKFSVIRKCVFQIIDAAKILKNKNYDLKFYIAGNEGNYFKLVKSYVEKHDLSSIVKILGYVSDKRKRRLLQECKIYLQPTLFEGFGVAIAEALSCCTPVVTSNVGAVGEVTNRNCRYVNGENAEDIANGIIEVLKNYKCYLKMAIKGKTYVKTEFHYNRRLIAFQKLLNKYDLNEN